MAVGLLGMLVTVFTMLVGRRRVLLGLLVLPVGVVVGRLQVMMCRRLMVCRGLLVMLDSRVCVLLRHDLALQRFRRAGALHPRSAPRWS